MERSSQDNKTAIEVFLSAVKGLDPTFQAMLAQGITGFEGIQPSSRSAADMRRDVIQ
jgi:hypothetical protein